MNWSDRDNPNRMFNDPRAIKTNGHINKRNGHTHTRHLTNQRESDAVKRVGALVGDGIKFPGFPGREWFDQGPAKFSSGSISRKAASAIIAKIPFDLAQHIARVYRPR